jgi:hypothetical protein
MSRNPERVVVPVFAYYNSLIQFHGIVGASFSRLQENHESQEAEI